MQSLMTCCDLFEELRMPTAGNAPRGKAVSQEGLVLGPTAENVHPDVVLRDVIIAGDKFLAFSSQPGHFVGSRELLLVDMELALGVISVVLSCLRVRCALRARNRTS
jgi:hypothetical protein